MPRCSALSFQNANIRICFHSETDFTFKFRVPVSILSQILVTGVEFCQEEVMGLGHGCESLVFAPVVLLIELHGCRLRGFAPVVLHIVLHGCRLWVFAPVAGFTGANLDFLPPSAFMDVVPNCGKGPLSSWCFAIRRGLCRCSVYIVMTALYISRK